MKKKYFRKYLENKNCAIIKKKKKVEEEKKNERKKTIFAATKVIFNRKSWFCCVNQNIVQNQKNIINKKNCVVKLRDEKKNIRGKLIAAL